MCAIELNKRNRCFSNALSPLVIKGVFNPIDDLHRRFEKEYGCKIEYKHQVYPYKLHFDNDINATLFLLKWN